MATVLKFPHQNKKVPSAEELDVNIEAYKLSKVDIVADELYEDLFTKMHLFGFDTTKDSDYKDVALVVESIRSLLCKTYGVTHPLQQFAEKSVTFEVDVDVESD